MNYLTLPHMDSPVSVFDIAQAHAQLEADYNVGGWVRERPSNQRRRESTGCQLSRLAFHPGIRWVVIYPEPGVYIGDDEPGDEDVRDIYIQNALKWALPITPEERVFIAARYVPEFLATFPSWSSS
jgi:hypothetical protein